VIEAIKAALTSSPSADERGVPVRTSPPGYGGLTSMNAELTLRLLDGRLD